MTRTLQPLLPPEFSELEPFVADWALPTETARYEKRLASSMEEIQRFYDAIAPRADAARDYLDEFPLSELPEEAQRLLWLLFSLITVSYAVDVFGEVRVPHTLGVEVLRVGEPPTFPV